MTFALATSASNGTVSRLATTLSRFVGAEVGVDVGDEVGEAVLNIVYAVVTDCKELPLLACNTKSNAPVAMDSFNAWMNIAVAWLVSLKMKVGVAMLYITSHSCTVERDLLLCTTSVTSWMVTSSFLLSKPNILATVCLNSASFDTLLFEYVLADIPANPCVTVKYTRTLDE